MIAFLHLIIFLTVAPATAESFESWSAKAEKARQRNENSAAIAAWEQALKLWDKRDGRRRKAKAHSSRAELFEKTGAYSSALGEMNQAISLGLKTPQAYHRRGRLYMKNDRLTEAIDDFYRAAKLDIRLGAVYADRADAYERKGDLKFAREDRRTACSLGVTNACAGAAPTGKRSINFDACLDAIDSCTEQLNSISICVKRVPTCDSRNRRGCCPRRCVQQFAKAATPQRSDAEVFRRVFSVKGSCRSAR